MPIHDTTLLAPARWTLVLIADTHQMPEGAMAGKTEFASRGKQTDRARVALRIAADLQGDLNIHLGDLAQAHPESDSFDEVIAGARQVMAECGYDGHFVAGNQDVGDKADPTMPTKPVTAATLDQYERWFGRTWYGLDLGPVRCLVINSQILNRDDLAQSGQQRRWLETQLAQHTDRRIFLFLHLPLYLGVPTETGFGHYDNVDQPARGWLVDLIRQYRIERVFTGHVHWRFVDRLGPTRYQTMLSPAFTRPGFGHGFTSGPAPEQGRDDRDKLGLLMVRITDDHAETHLIRTGGITAMPEPIERGEARWLVTRTTASLDRSAVGVSLNHPLTPRAQVPLAWPSVVRQPIRNDYPLLALQEIGARHLRTPGHDLDDPDQRERIALARDEAMAITATYLDHGDHAKTLQWARDHQAQMDGLELRVPGGGIDSELIALLRNLSRSTDLALSLSPVLAHEVVKGKQHPRTRMGYHLDETEALNQALAGSEVTLDRVVYRLDAEQEPWPFFQRLRAMDIHRHLNASDVLVELRSQDDQANAHRVARAMLGCATCRHVRLYFDPLVDFDRTMDATHGLLNTLCNPRPAFHVVRMLNTILFANGQNNEPIEVHDDGSIHTPRSILTLDQDPQDAAAGIHEAANTRLYDLQAGTVREGPLSRLINQRRESLDNPPWLWVINTEQTRGIEKDQP